MTVDTFTHLDVPYPSLLKMQLVRTSQTREVGWRVFDEDARLMQQCILCISTVPGFLLASWNCWLIGSYFLVIFGSPGPYLHASLSVGIQEICVDVDIKLCSSFEKVIVRNQVLLVSKSLMTSQPVSSTCETWRALTWESEKAGFESQLEQVLNAI